MINTEEFQKKTKQSLKDSLAYSRKLIDRFDPDYEDIQGRKSCTEFLNELEDAIEGVE